MLSFKIKLPGQTDTPSAKNHPPSRCYRAEDEEIPPYQLFSELRKRQATTQCTWNCFETNSAWFPFPLILSSFSGVRSEWRRGKFLDLENARVVTHFRYNVRWRVQRPLPTESAYDCWWTTPKAYGLFSAVLSCFRFRYLNEFQFPFSIAACATVFRVFLCMWGCPWCHLALARRGWKCIISTLALLYAHILCVSQAEEDWTTKVLFHPWGGRTLDSTWVGLTHICIPYPPPRRLNLITIEI